MFYHNAYELLVPDCLGQQRHLFVPISFICIVTSSHICYLSMTLIGLRYWGRLGKEQEEVECSVGYRNYTIYGHYYYVCICHVFKKSMAKRLANLVSKALKHE